MSTEHLGRERILREYQYLLENTDRNHPASTRQLLEMLEEKYGIRTDRNTLAKDMAVLTRVCGIETRRGAEKVFFCSPDETEFTEEDLGILLDCVRSGKFISRKKSRELEKKILHLAKSPEREHLSHRAEIEVPDRIVAINSPVEKAATILSDAIAAKKRVMFQYITYNAHRERKLKSSGKIYILSPYRLLWDGDFLYVVGYCDSHDRVQTFRVDRVEEKSLSILEQAIVPCPADFSMDDYNKSRFRMFGGSKEETVTLRCSADAMNSLVDHFGKDFALETIDENSFRADVSVCPSRTFYRWVFGFDGNVRIEGPDHVRKEYEDMLTRALGNP